MTVTVKPRKVLYFLLFIIAILTILNLMGILFVHYTDYPKINKYIVGLIDFDREANIPTFYSTFLLLVAALLLGFITAAKRKLSEDYKRWLGLCLFFVFLGVDEFVSFHELLSGPVRSLLDVDGILYLAWVVPYATLAAGIFLVYLKFLLKLPSYVKVMFVLSGAIYIAGAIGCEMLGSSYYSINDTANIRYGLFYTAEELLEMVGVAIFIYGLLSYIQYEIDHRSIKFVIASPNLASGKEYLVKTQTQKKH